MAVMSADSAALIVSRSGTLSHASTAIDQDDDSQKRRAGGAAVSPHFAPVTFGGEPGFGGSVV
jgi:hypothetical protein